MSKWIKGRDVMNQLDIEAFELADYIRAGLTPFDKYGRPFRQADLPEGPGQEIYTPEEIETLVQDEMKRELRRRMPTVAPAGGNPSRQCYSGLRPPSEERELRKIAENNIRALPYFPHKAERSWRHFRLLASCRDAERVIQEILDWRFQMNDVLKLMPEGNAENQEQKPVERMTEKDIFWGHIRLTAQRLKIAKPYLNTKQIATKLRDEAKKQSTTKKKLPLADYSVEYIMKHLTGTCKRGKPSKSR
jgi:hypothetical protein